MTLPDLPISFELIAKIGILFLIGLYALFVLITFINIRSLNKLIIVQRSTGSPLVNIVSFIYLILTLFLFVLALVIL